MHETTINVKIGHELEKDQMSYMGRFKTEGREGANNIIILWCQKQKKY